MGLVMLPSIVVQSYLWGSKEPGDQVCLGDLVVGGNFVFCLIIVVIFTGLGRAYTLKKNG